MKKWILAFAFLLGSLWSMTAAGETNTFVFVPDQSIVVQTGGFAGVYETYSIEGQFQLTVDYDAGIASFNEVDANLTDESIWLYTRDLGVLFNMTELAGTVISDTTIEFEGRTADDTNTEIHILATLTGNSACLIGETVPPCCDFFIYNLDAVALLLPNTYYVDAVNGDDNNDGLSPETAFATIQKGINDSNDGDTIIVADGTYTGDGNRDIDFKGKAITLRSKNGPENCIIDCQGTETEPHRGFYFHSGEAEDSVVDGFAIINGYASSASPQQLEWGGGGILCRHGSSPTIRDCIITGNTTLNGTGGGIRASDRTVITDCTIKGNYAVGLQQYGPGGGGISCGSNTTVSNCTISGNTAVTSGGGILCTGNATILNCAIVGNSAGDGGGIGCRFWGDAMISNCTISGNFASSRGGGISCLDSSPTLVNCILWGDSSPRGPEISNSCLYGSFVITISYSDVQGGQAQASVYTGCPLDWGPGNIDVDPCFADIGYWADGNDPNIPVEPNDPNAIWIDGDYHLQSAAGRWDPNSQSWLHDDVTSPCIDAGNPGCPLGDESNDVNNIRINMGAYGGRAEASKSPANWRSIADLTNDWTVDLNDLKVFVNYWLDTSECIPSDLNRNLFVDFSDFAIFGQQWSDTFAIEPGMTYQIDDCNMEAGQTSPVAAEADELRFSVRVEGNYIHFEDLITANCCADEIELQMTVEDNLITIYEIEHLTMPCDCICDYPVTATLGPFEEGNYLVEVIDVNGSSLGVVEVAIGESIEPSITYQIEDCNPAAAGLFAEEEAIPTRFSAVVEGQYIHFEDMMTANCCPDRVWLEMDVDNNQITIYEREAGGVCYCICDYPVTATLGPFEPGTYILEVYEDWGGFIGSTVVTIGPAE